MKIYEMNTCDLSRTLCRIAGPIERIGTDETVNEALKMVFNAKNERTTTYNFSSFFGKIAPALLDAHFDDTVEIVSAMTGKTAQEVRDQNGMQTIMDIKSFLDEDFVNFFGSSVAQAQKK